MSIHIYIHTYIHIHYQYGIIVDYNCETLTIIYYPCIMMCELAFHIFYFPLFLHQYALIHHIVREDTSHFNSDVLYDVFYMIFIYCLSQLLHTTFTVL